MTLTSDRTDYGVYPCIRDKICCLGIWTRLKLASRRNHWHFKYADASVEKTMADIFLPIRFIPEVAPAEPSRLAQNADLKQVVKHDSPRRVGGG